MSVAQMIHNAWTGVGSIYPIGLHQRSASEVIVEITLMKASSMKMYGEL